MTPTVLHVGVFQLYGQVISFESHHLLNLGNGVQYGVQKLREIELSQVMLVLRRRHLHQDDSCELFCRDGASYFFIFPLGVRAKLEPILTARDIYVQTGPASQVLQDLKIVEMWQSGELSNYSYLYWLNMIGGRSFCDLSQYPVYPWVISDYESDDLDLRLPSSYRDLALPIGLINTDRFEVIRQLNQPGAHFTTLYSNPTIVANYLVRTEPFTTCHVDQQNGQFDQHLFASVARTWHDVQFVVPDFRELVPEFFCFPGFLRNDNRLDLGEFGDVVLPKWAKTADEFVHINRKALESPNTSANLNGWVDLIFGFRSRGQNAQSFSNDFIESAYSEVLTGQLTPQITDAAFNLGVVSQQIFWDASPKRTPGPICVFLRSISPEPLADVTEAQRLLALSADRLLLIKKGGEVLYFDVAAKTCEEAQYNERFAGYFTREALMEFCPGAQLLLIGSSRRKCVYCLALTGDGMKNTFSGIANLGIPRQVSISAAKVVATGDAVFYLTCLSEDNFFVVWHSVLRDGGLGEVQKVPVALERRRIVAMDISASLRIAATITEAPELVLRRLPNGQTYRKAELDTAASYVKITTQGLVVVLSQGKLPEGIRCRIDLFDLNCRKLCSRAFAEKMRLWEVAALDSVDDLIVMCFGNRVLMAFRVFGLVTVSYCELENKPIAMGVGDGRTVFLLFRHGSIASVKVRL
jgi:hypothetical protein